MGEVEYAPGEPKGTPWHPHRGFETVTYMIDGTFQHQDSIGGGGLITNGSTQWMTAGSGILHIERPTEQLIATGGLFHGIQLWVNLPSSPEDGRPALPGPRRRGVGAADLARRRRAGAGHRRRRGRAPWPRLDLLTHLAGPRHRCSPGAELVLPWPTEFNALVYVLWPATASSAPTHRPIHSGQLAVHGAGDALTHPGRPDAGEPPPGARRPDSGRAAHPASRW